MSKYKRWLIRVIGFLFVLLIYSLWKEIDKETGTPTALLRGLFVGISLLWITKISEAKKVDKETKIESYHNKTSNQSLSTYQEEKYYSIVLKEIELDNLSSGLWSKALAYSDGNPDKAKSFYLKERANQLIQMHQEKLNRVAKDSAPNKIDKKPVSAGRIFSVILCSGIIVSIFVALAPSSNSTPDIGQRANDLDKNGQYAEPLPVNKTSAIPIVTQKPILSSTSRTQRREAFDLYKQGKYVEAFPLIQLMADEGSSFAQDHLGTMYLNGEGVPKDYSQAVYWFRKAADQGDALALRELGDRYKYGEGVPKDYSQAVYLYRKAAETGASVAQVYLGSVYYNGEGVPQDYNQAVYWYRKAADQGNAEAIAILSKLGLK